MAKTKPPGLSDVLRAMGTANGEAVYAAFLQSEAERGDYTFLLNDIGRSNLRPAAKLIANAIITGKLKRSKHRPPANDTDLKNAWRALRVMDLESNGWSKRDAAIAEATRQLGCKRRTLEKALADFEDMLSQADPQSLDSLRSAFK